ncbi:MAG: hypothetical protein V1758_08325 [Pseudomonadota bacterium]
MFLSEPIAILIGFVLAALIITTAAKSLGIPVLTALTAIGTFGAVVVALWHQDLRSILRRPKFQIALHEPEEPHLIKLMGTVPGIAGPEEYKGLFVVCHILNDGKETAFKSQVHLTNLYRKDQDGIWRLAKPWIPLPLKWVIPISAWDLEREMGRDLVSKIPYLFTIASFSKEKRDGQVLFTYYSSNRIQPETLTPGEYCFELTAFAVGVDNPFKQYLFVTFNDFVQEPTLDAVKSHVTRIDIADKPPKWQGTYPFYS